MKKLLILPVLCLMYACSDILETKISGKEVSVVAPLDGSEVAEGPVSFLWNTLDGAERYRVTIVSPSFESASIAVRDTVMYPDSLSLSRKRSVKCVLLGD